MAGLGIGADAGNENEAGDTGGSSLPRESFGALLVHRLERYAPLLDIGGDRIDDGVGPDEDGGDRGLVAHVGAEDRNPVPACSQSILANANAEDKETLAAEGVREPARNRHHHHVGNVSLPHIAGDLSSSQNESTWVLTSYPGRLDLR